MKFQPVSHSWIALHPKAKGVIQFVGGALFGTFWPMFFYRSLLQRLFNDGYTIVILPFNFTFDHYAEAGFLIREQYEIMPELVRRAIFAGYDFEPYLKDQNFSWLGHSVGCKYIALLEAFSTLPEISKPSDPDYNHDIQKLIKFIDSIVRSGNQKDSPVKIERKVDSILADLLILINDLEIKRREAVELIRYYIGNINDIRNNRAKITETAIGTLQEKVEISSIFIKNQPSLLLAPANTGLESAVPQPFTPIVIALGLNVKPTKEETFALIKEAGLFDLMGLIAFKKDKIAKETVDWFKCSLKKPPQHLQQDLERGHLEPLGIQLGSITINFPIPCIKFTEKRNKKLETPVSQLFQRLKDRIPTPVQK